MKRILLGVFVVGLFFSSTVPGLAQGGYGRGGPGWNQARGMGRQGLRNGMGPRALNGTCPRLAANAQANTPNVATPPGPGWRNGTCPCVLNEACPRLTANPQATTPNVSAPNGRGLRNGTGPRALNGTCPLLSPGASAPVPNTAVAK